MKRGTGEGKGGYAMPMFSNSIMLNLIPICIMLESKKLGMIVKITDKYLLLRIKIPPNTNTLIELSIRTPLRHCRNLNLMRKKCKAFPIEFA